MQMAFNLWFPGMHMNVYLMLMPTMGEESALRISYPNTNNKFRMFLKKSDEMKLKCLIKTCILISNERCTRTFSYHFSRSIRNFVSSIYDKHPDKLNNRVFECVCVSTH